MTVFEDFKSSSTCCKIALILLAIATLLSSISFTTTGWGSDTIIATSVTTYYGLWRICPSTDRVTGGCIQVDGWANEWFGAVQAMVIFGFFGTLISFFLVILYIFVGKCQRNGELGLAAGIICIVTGILYLIGCIVFGAQWDKFYKDTLVNDYALEYGFALSIVALAFEIIAGILLIVETKKGWTSS